MTIAAVPRPPRFVADTPEAVNETANSASRVTRESLSERRGFRNLQISAIPYLRASPAGATFLRQAAPRALAPVHRRDRVEPWLTSEQQKSVGLRIAFQTASSP